MDKNTLLILGAITLITLSEGIAQVSLRKYDQDPNILLFFSGIIFYSFVCILLVFCYKHHGYMSHVNIMWSMMSIILITLCGYYIYGEKIDSNDMYGMFFAFLAIYFINK